MLKVKRGSQQPEEFLNEVNTAVQTAVNNSQIGSHALVLEDAIDDDHDDLYADIDDDDKVVAVQPTAVPVPQPQYDDDDGDDD